MTTQERQQTMFVGIDVHKETHTAVGVSPFGEKLFELKVGNDERDFNVLASQVEKVKGVLSPHVGLEDCHGYGERIAEYLADRYPVTHVPSILVDRLRQKTTHPEKTDSLDALGVAKAMMHDIDSLSAFTLTQEGRRAKQIREISLDREHLALERARLKNHLHSLLYRIWNTAYQTKYKNPFSLKALRYWSRSRPECDPYLCRTMKRKARRLIDLHYEITELEKEMAALLEESGYTLQTASGCGVVLASVIIGEIGDISKFKSPAALAKYAGCAPREFSSGKRKRRKKTWSGNRRLNCALHRMALSQISRMGNDKARDYFQRKVSEGKSKSQALVCLRRQMVNLVWSMMKHKSVYRA